MFFDARNIEKDSVLDTDVCIVGGGAAGITVAREFDGVGKRIMLLEGGGLNYSRDSQDLYSGKNVGLPYVPLDVTRLRYFGGSTNHWGGIAGHWTNPILKCGTGFRLAVGRLLNLISILTTSVRMKFFSWLRMNTTLAIGNEN